MSKSSQVVQQLDSVINDALTALWPETPPGALAVAVSGGPDSLALTLLLEAWCRRQAEISGIKPRLIALTVDHQLRPESGQEAAQVAQWLEGLEIEHRTLVWSQADSDQSAMCDLEQERALSFDQEMRKSSLQTLCHPALVAGSREAKSCALQINGPRNKCGVTAEGDDHRLKTFISADQTTGQVPTQVDSTSALPNNIQAKARAARYALLHQACHQEGVNKLFLGHHRLDQVTTFLMRLQRGSGIRGLGGMQGLSYRESEGEEGGQALRVVRPLLDIDPQQLQAYLQEQSQPWLSDPTNEDPSYLRTRMQTLVPILEQHGLSQERIALAQSHCREAEETLAELTQTLFEKTVTWSPYGYATLDKQALLKAPTGLQKRLLAEVMHRVAGHEANQPEARGRTRETVHTWLHSQQTITHTAGGCLFRRRQETLLVLREAAALKASAPLPPGTKGHLWDNRFLVDLPEHTEPLIIAPLREQDKHTLKDQLTKVPHAAALALPAFYTKSGQFIGLPTLIGAEPSGPLTGGKAYFKGGLD